jgi:hypothetical protein
MLPQKILSNIDMRITIHHERNCLDSGLFFECEVFILFIQERID